MFKLAALVALISLSGVARTVESGFMQILEDEMLIVGGDSEHFAIAMERLNWTAISVNGDSATIVDLECQVGEKSLSELGEQQRSLLGSVAKRLLRRSRSQLGFGRGQANSASIGADEREFVTSGNLTFGEFNHSHFYIREDNMLHGIKTVFYDDNFITLLYEDGNVLMQQASCFDEEQQLYFVQLVTQLLEKT